MEKGIPKRHMPRVLMIIDKMTEIGEIGDNSLVIDVYQFKRGRRLHVYYDIYGRSSKSAAVVYES